MRTRQYRETRMGRLIVPAVACSFLAYFAFHAQTGKYGLEAKTLLVHDLSDSQHRLDLLVAQRERLEKRVQLLHDGTLERDMIDERARQALNLSAPDEIIILK